MAPGGRDLDRVAGVLLTDDVGEVGRLVLLRDRDRAGAAQLDDPREPRQHLVEALGAVHLEALDQRRLGQSGLGDDDAPGLRRPGREQAGQHAADRPQPPVEGQLPE